MKAKLLSVMGSTEHFRITGRPTSQDWLSSLRVPPESAWCDISVIGDTVVGFGGEVWPGAWPELFNPPPCQNYAKGCHTLTDAGKALLANCES